MTPKINMPVQIICGDAVEKLRELADCSVQLVVTSPPYDDLRTYGGFKWDFDGLAMELYRVLCKGGIVCWNVGDSVVKGSETLTSFRQAIYFKDKVGFRVHDTMIWHKLNFSSPSFNRYHQCFEYVFIFSKGEPRCFNPIIDRPNSTAGQGCFGVNSFAYPDGSRDIRRKHTANEMGMRHNVWKGKTRSQEEVCDKLPHPAMMPKWLTRDLILSWSNPGDTVLDPMAGSGTTGTQAIECGRNAILIELNPEYIPLIEQRTNVTPGLKLG